MENKISEIMSHSVSEAEVEYREFTFKPMKDSSQSTFVGRFMHFQKVVDPRNFLVTKA